LRRRDIATFAGDAAAEIIDEDLGPIGRERERMGAPKPATAAGDDGDLTCQQITHNDFPLF
jgi:hypothetical protein